MLELSYKPYLQYLEADFESVAPSYVTNEFFLEKNSPVNYISNQLKGHVFSLASGLIFFSINVYLRKELVTNGPFVCL